MGERPNAARRSAAWFARDDVSGFIHRAFTKASGYDAQDLQRPIIGIAQTWSELNHCNSHLRGVAEAVKRGVWQAGGTPFEFPTISLGEIMVKPTTMLYRNLMAMDTEEMIRCHPLDGVVLLCGCDKTTPAQLMGAASADVPAIVVTGGPMLNGHYRGRELGACTDCRLLEQERRAGTLPESAWREMEDAICRSAGHCMVMGTASTMACMAEALGMTLPGGASIPAADSRRLRLAEASGRRIVQAVEEDLRPSRILTRAAFENAIRVCMAIGGSTNAVIHLIAIAGRLGIELRLDLFDRLSRETPFLANIRPSGQFQMEELFEAGGLPAVMKELRPLLHEEALTISGAPLAEQLAAAENLDARVIRSLAEPLHPEGGTIVLRGNLCPAGAVLKQTAASPELLRHEGRAVVFESLDDLQARVDDPDLDVEPGDVMVLKGCGPVGAPGMPERGNLPIPKKLLQRGIRDIVRISDGRMSGTAFGTVVLHVAPESAVGGPLALVENGDRIRLDAAARRLELLVDDAELAARKARWQARRREHSRGYGWLYQQHVLQADQGCDFDFLRFVTPDGIG
jgi:dihydroxy-acid dehydratase